MSKITYACKSVVTRSKIGALLAALLVLTLACTTAQEQLIQGILQDVDSANGEITIVTKDGKTVTLTISTDAEVETEGTASAFEALEPGVEIEASVTGDGGRTDKISARQSKVEGQVLSIEGDQVSIQTGGGAVSVTVDQNTRIELEDDLPGAMSDIKIGAEIEAKFDPSSGVAFKLDLEQEESEIEGLVDKVDGNQVTIRTERGRLLTVVVGNNTRIELDDDSLGTMADITEGLEIEVDFDPSSLAAFEIEIEGDEDDDDDNEEDSEDVDEDSEDEDGEDSEDR